MSCREELGLKGKRKIVACKISQNSWGKGTYLHMKCQNPLMGVLDNFFPTGTYTGIVTSVSSLKHVMKSTTKKKILEYENQSEETSTSWDTNSSIVNESNL